MRRRFFTRITGVLICTGVIAVPMLHASDLAKIAAKAATATAAASGRSSGERKLNQENGDDFTAIGGSEAERKQSKTDTENILSQIDRSLAEIEVFDESVAVPAKARTALLLAGRPSHGPGEHEHNAGILLLARCLRENVPGLNVVTHLSGEWPSGAELARADTIVFYADGGGGHPAIQQDRIGQVGAQMKRGAGLVCIHYAVEFPRDKGGPEFVNWLGGYFEPNWSVNPHWTANFRSLPEHAVTRGVQPFSTHDEWYFHMRFRDGMKGVQPILTDLPPDSTMSRPDGPHSGNPDVRRAIAHKEPQHVAWAAEREDGGRAFGFTGGHFHQGWGNEDQRKLLLNAILWTARLEVPAGGVPSRVTAEELRANQDPKPGAKKAVRPVDSKAD